MNLKGHLLGALLALCPCLGNSQNYTLEGEITYTPSPDQGTSKKTGYKFEVWVSGEQWRIRNTPKEFKGIHYQENAFDGKEVRELTQLDPTANPDSENKAIAKIQTTGVPSEDPPMQLTSVWLAYASGAYLRSVDNGRIPPLWPVGPGVRESDLTWPARWSFSEEAPHLLKELEVFSTGRNYTINNDVIVDRELAPPYNNGFRMAHFKVQAVTNVGGLTFPLQFTFERFGAKQDGNTTNDLVRLTHLSGVVEVVKLEEALGDFFPEMQYNTLVNDKRFANELPFKADVQYLVTNKNWPATNNPGVQKVLKQQQRMHPKGKPASEPGRISPLLQSLQ